jgi:polyvinyl alcohol dehydrogenase (cytochrome)
MRIVRILPLLGAVALLAGCGAKEGLSDADKARAEALYKANCAACHDSAGSGAPARAALESRKPAAILASLETGLMREQGKALQPDERKLLADYLGAKSAKVAGKMCEGSLKLAGAPLWNRWGNGIENRRFQPAAKGEITPANVGALELKWAFAFPDAARARSQPAVTEEAIFTGSPDGRVYALNRESGCIWWTFDAESEVRSAPTLGEDGNLYFGDFNANIYAVDAKNGKLVWKQSVKDHPAGTITGSPTLHDGRLYVPMSSTEVVSAMKAEYECCTFRGGVTALDAANGKRLWRMHTVDVAAEAGVDQKGQRALGPSGAPVWSVPTVDAKRGLLYIGTGENYSSPASAMSDSIIAVELATGKIRWWRQTVANDAWNASCGTIGDNVNCPREDGPDLDFGAPPILTTLADGRDIILAGQKSGMVFALDPDDGGKILWKQRAGMGGFNGGVHWGMASDASTLYVGIADTPGNKGAVGPRRPGIHAFDIATGKPRWSRIEPFTCAERKFECETAFSAPVTATDGIVFGGAHNGLLRAYSTTDGTLLWSFDTRRDFSTVNGVKGYGGSIDSAGPVLAGGLLIVNSGYDKFGEIPGNVLLVFGPRKAAK